MATFPLCVLKFGSSVLPDEAALPRAVAEIGRWTRRGFRVVAVVSALGETTDRLIARGLAAAGGERPDDIAFAALQALGEAEAVALLGVALARAGISANVADAGAIGLRTTGPTLDAATESIDAGAVWRLLADRPVLVLPGFVGRDELGRATLLGRGGSDLTALFLADRVRAERCVLFKDVDGLYDRDPAADASARRFAAVSWEDVLRLDEGIVQHKAVRFARDRRLAFNVACLGADSGTLVGPGPTVAAAEVVAPAPAGKERVA